MHLSIFHHNFMLILVTCICKVCKIYKMHFLYVCLSNKLVVSNENALVISGQNVYAVLLYLSLYTTN